MAPKNPDKDKQGQFEPGISIKTVIIISAALLFAITLLAAPWGCGRGAFDVDLWQPIWSNPSYSTGGGYDYFVSYRVRGLILVIEWLLIGAGFVVAMYHLGGKNKRHG